MSLFDKQGEIATEEEISAIPAETVATGNVAGNASGQSRCNENNPPRKECVRGQRQHDDESRRC